MFDKVSNNLRILEKSLDATLLRHEVITQNIANVDTPNYKKSTVKFEEFLSNALNDSNFKGFKTNSRHIDIGGSNIESVNPVVTKDNKELSTRLDGNNVDIEAEEALQAQNILQYNTLVQSLNSGFNRLKTAITEGRK
jgi:flagellar basal-body rod protein FlgB